MLDTLLRPLVPDLLSNNGIVSQINGITLSYHDFSCSSKSRHLLTAITTSLLSKAEFRHIARQRQKGRSSNWELTAPFLEPPPMYPHASRCSHDLLTTLPARLVMSVQSWQRTAGDALCSKGWLDSSFCGEGGEGVSFERPGLPCFL